MKDFIPAYTGAIVMANPGTNSFHSLDSDYDISGNLIEGVMEPTSIATLKADGGYDAILTLGQGRTGEHQYARSFVICYVRRLSIKK